MQNYGLFIVEDDGEVDWAFPCLDKSEPCSKFGFTCLGLVDLKKRDNIIMASPIPDFDMNSAFQCFPKVSVSGQSNVNTSRLHTGDSDTTEVLRAMNTVIDGEENGMFPFLLWSILTLFLFTKILKVLVTFACIVQLSYVIINNTKLDGKKIPTN